MIVTSEEAPQAITLTLEFESLVSFPSKLQFCNLDFRVLGIDVLLQLVPLETVHNITSEF